MTYLQYDTATGLETGSNCLRVPDEDLPPGIAQTPLPEGMSPGRVRVNAATGAVELYDPPDE